MTIKECLLQIEIALEQINELFSFALINRIEEIGAHLTDFTSPFFNDRAGGGDQHASCPNKT